MTRPRRWLVTGAAGMLGRDVVDVLRGEDVAAPGRAELDVTDERAVADAVAGRDVVVNCAGWTAVDDAEGAEGEAFAANAVGPWLLARACHRAGARLVHVSTDYVFSGDAREPYPVDAAPGPRTAYGRTKAAGEWAVRSQAPGQAVVLRTAWLYGEHGTSFPRTVLRLAASRPTLDVVDDQWGQPTWSRDVARRIRELVEHDVPAGTYHASSSGRTTWFALARHLLQRVGDDPERVRPTTSQAFVRPAARPAWSVLDHSAWSQVGLAPLRGWRDALEEALAAGVLGRP